MKSLISALIAITGFGQLGCASLNPQTLRTGESYSACQADSRNLRALVRSELECMSFLKKVGSTTGHICKNETCEVLSLKEAVIMNVAKQDDSNER